MTRILCYGDSNTYGTAPFARLGTGDVHDKATRWAGVMAAELGAAFDVVVEGLPGRTTVFDDPVEGEYRNGLRPLRAILESHNPVDLLILALGTNDQKHRFGLLAQDVALGVARLLKEIGHLDVVDHVLVVCPPPVKERGDLATIFAGAESRMVGLPAEIARFAAEQGAAFLDAGKHIAVDDLDGVHLTADSHAVLGRAMAAKVQEVLS